LHRGEQRIQVEPIEAGAPVFRLLSVVTVQPVDKLKDIPVTPHPAGEALEVPECLNGVAVLATASHPPVHTVGVGPIGLYRHGGKTLLLD
jgi:hypothetical protein